MSRYVAAQVRPYVDRDPDPPRAVSLTEVVRLTYSFAPARNVVLFALFIVPFSVYELVTSPYLSTRALAVVAALGVLTFTLMPLAYAFRVLKAVRQGAVVSGTTGRARRTKRGHEIELAIHHPRGTFNRWVEANDVSETLVHIGTAVDLLVDPNAPRLYLILPHRERGAAGTSHISPPS
jgi:hypothetical protein